MILLYMQLYALSQYICIYMYPIISLLYLHEHYIPIVSLLHPHDISIVVFSLNDRFYTSLQVRYITISTDTLW